MRYDPRCPVLLLLIRHGIAEDRVHFALTGLDDADRPLTRSGRKKMIRAARGLRKIEPTIDLLVTSPLLRARETRGILTEEFGPAQVAVLDELAPNSSPSQFLNWLAACDAEVVGAVGHEPGLSRLASWLATGTSGSAMALKKGGVCALSFAGVPERGSAVLQWLLTPGQLRRLAR